MKSPSRPITAKQLDDRIKRYLEKHCDKREDGHYSCKKCGSPIKAAIVYITVLRGRNQLADKEVITHRLPYCRYCEDEPQISFQIRA